jgi:hypothetical protein
MYSAKQWSDADPNVAYFLSAFSLSPVIVVGNPGTAKSQSALRFMRAQGIEPVLKIGATMAPEDAGGIPFIDRQQPNYFSCTPPDWAYSLTNEKSGLFLDEFNNAPPQVEAAFLSMLTERRLGNVHIHPQCLMMAAMNPVELCPNGQTLSLATKNRFGWFDWKFSWETFEDGIVTEDDDFKLKWIPVVPPDWGRFKTKWGHTIANYLRKNSADRLRVPDNDTESAYPTPRSWHYLRNALACADSCNAPADIMKEIMEAYVGRSTSISFAQYVDSQDLIDPEAAIDDPKSFKYDRKRPDLAVVLMSSVTSCIKQHYSDQRFTNAVDLFCNNIGSHSKELCFAHLKHLVKSVQGSLPTGAVEIIRAFGNTLPASMKGGNK